MKKVLLLFVSLIFAQLICPSAIAYETVIVDFPYKQGWHEAYYGVQGNEAILQYTPAGQTAQSWTRSVIFHSYKGLNEKTDAAKFMDNTTSQMEVQNSSQRYTYMKYTDVDSIATRCITKNAYTPTQCEIYRVSTSHEGLITMHYINKNVQDFKNTYSYWYQIMKDIRIYYSYYRTDRVLDKATIFEL